MLVNNCRYSDEVGIFYWIFRTFINTKDLIFIDFFIDEEFIKLKMDEITIGEEIHDNNKAPDPSIHWDKFTSEDANHEITQDKVNLVVDDVVIQRYLKLFCYWFEKKSWSYSKHESNMVVCCINQASKTWKDFRV